MTHDADALIYPPLPWSFGPPRVAANLLADEDDVGYEAALPGLQALLAGELMAPELRPAL